ncbi:flagellinolysin [Chitinivorax sp. PXF-14]|uniref:flagellinolysin n=1 Tax=Chitinivorax sp. PXF-14 TaxID=3230488 RepID=UPI003467C9C8
MQIATNLQSLFAQRQLETASSGNSRALQRLSSGLRVNTARDDAAGLAISERLRAQINGSNQAWRNTNDSVSLLQTADGALTKVNDIMQRLRELSVQANNATLQASDRQALQGEANQLTQEISRIASSSEFNGQSVFSQVDASIGGDKNRRAVLDGLKLGWLEEAEQRVQKYYGIIADGALTMDVNLNTSDGVGNKLASVSTTAVGGNGQWQNITLNIDMADFTPPNLPNGGSAPIYNDRIIAHEMVHAEMSRSMNFNALPSWFKEGSAEFIHGADERLAGDTAGGTDVTAILAAFNADDVSASAGYSGGYAAVRYMHEKIKAAGGDGIKDIMTYLGANPAATLDQALTNASHGAFANLAGFSTSFNTNAAAFVGAMNLSNADTGAVGGADVDGGTVLSAQDILLDRGERAGNNVLDGFKLNFPTQGGGSTIKEFQFQVGANADQTITARMQSFSAISLGIDDIDLVQLPTFALAHLDEAMDFVNRQRADIGAMLNRLQATSDNLKISEENTSAARSRIVDTDYAQETATLTREQILTQAATAMLAQANSQPNLALSLLRS